jgi:hypothetical protein
VSSKAKDEMHLRPSFESFIDDDIRFSLELTTFTFNIKSKVFGVLDSFLSLLRTYEKKKTHNFLSLMLDLKFLKNCLVFSYVDKKQGVSIMEQYDKRALYPMLVKSYNHLHLVEDVVFSFANQDVY